VRQRSFVVVACGADCSSLRRLDLSGNKFGLVGVERLLEAVDVARLSAVNLSSTIGPGHAHHLLKLLAKLLVESVRNRVSSASALVECLPPYHLAFAPQLC